MKPKISAICIFAVILLAAVPFAEASTSLGSAQDRKYAEVYPGEIVQFKIFLFNIHDNSNLSVNLVAKEVPAGWSVDINPSSFQLEYSIPQVYTSARKGMNTWAFREFREISR